MARVIRVLLLGLAALICAGCGTGGLAESGADRSRGKELFTAQCGSCHALADAGTRGTVGPNLDEAFAFARTEEQRFEESTIREVVHQQIKYPAPPMPGPDVTFRRSEDRDADIEAVAAYVASVVAMRPAGGQAQGGGGGGQAGGSDGKSIFASAGCGSCHALADAGSSGTIGPNLDDSKPSRQVAIQRVTNGKGAMPAFRDQLSRQEIQAVAGYVARAAGK